ncbi:MAG: NAD-dependent deacetylase [Deltaproteobacteria bacterium]|nr:NAD-dependent deacetylase [Deltaproteobacteria bacterium]
MAPEDPAAALAQIRSWIDAAERIVVLTGAGISTDSGIPDFRGPKGVWTKDPDAEKMSNIQYYVADPEIRRRSWRAKMAGAEQRREPNAGHRALTALDQRRKLHLLVTQNVDGLHHEAGSDPERIVEIHGTLREYACLDCDDRGPIDRVFERVRAGDDDPACKSCGGILKSATISFGQGLVTTDLQRADLAAQNCDLLLAVGSTLGVYPIAGIVPVAKQSGARIVIVNAEATEMDGLADALVRGSISEVLPRIL